MRTANRLAEMETFLAVADEGNFSSAALNRRMTPSAVSKMMTRLEQRLGVTLLRRTTRQIRITEEGKAFAKSARAVLAALDQAEREAGCGPVAGTVRIATSAAYANHILAPILPEFLQKHRDLEIELVIGDGLVDMGGQPIDLAVRAGPLPDSSLRARSLGVTEIISVRRRDATDEEVGFAYARRDPVWQGASPRLRATDGNTIAAMAVHGCGKARVARFTVEEQLQNGQLLLAPGNRRGHEEFHLIYLGAGRTLPARISTVIDFLIAKGRVDRTAM